MKSPALLAAASALSLPRSWTRYLVTLSSKSWGAPSIPGPSSGLPIS